MKTREGMASVTREHKFLEETEETFVLKNLDETVRLQSEKREKWVRKIRERLHATAEGTSIAPRLASSLATVVVVVVGYPTPSEGWGHGRRPWSPRSRATPQGLDQRS